MEIIYAEVKVGYYNTGVSQSGSAETLTLTLQSAVGHTCDIEFSEMVKGEKKGFWIPEDHSCRKSPFLMNPLKLTETGKFLVGAKFQGENGPAHVD